MATTTPITYNATNLPAQSGVSLSAGSDTLLAVPIRAFYVGVTGNVKITDLSGVDLTFTAVPAGVVIPIGCLRVYATGTTATSIVGLY